MEKQRLSYLLDKHYKQQLTSDELIELDNWFHNIDHGTSDLDNWVAELGGKTRFVDTLHQRFEAKNGVENNNVVYYMWRIAAAALILCFLGTGLFLYYSKTNNNASSNLSAGIKIKNLPAVSSSSKAILTLPNGKQVDLTNSGNAQVVQGSDIKAFKTADGKIIYQNNNNSLSDSLFVVSTFTGGQYQVVLSDGTKVWLNAASSLKYSASYAVKERKVEITGEAYFEVAHNKNMPFVVTSKNQKIEVLGTHFNVQAYDDEPAVLTTLLEGSVKVSSLKSKETRLLKPGDQSILKDQKLSIHVADINEAIGWKNGYFVFNDEDIHNIMKQVSRWYNVEVAYDYDFKNKKFGAVIPRGKDVAEILSMLELTNSIHFKIEGRRVIVMK